MQSVKLEECQNDYCHPLENGFYKCWEGKRKSPGKCKWPVQKNEPPKNQQKQLMAS